MNTTRDQHFELFSDEPVQADDVQFGAKQIIERLSSIVQSCPTPYHIGLFGPWGAGKSTVLDAVQEHFKDGREVKVVRINAWKYRHDSLRRKFLLTVAQTLQPLGESTLKKRMYKIVSGLTEKREWKWSFILDADWWAGIWSQIKYPAMFSGVVFLVVIVTGILKAWLTLGLGLFSWHGVLVAREKASEFLQAPLLVFVITYLGTAIGRVYVENDDAVELNTEEQFEDQFKRSLKKLGATKRLLVVVDELDRCAPEQVVEALETVKTFMNVDRCVFLVACDRAILERALQVTLDPQGKRAREYLDKIFQLQFHLPPVMSADMTLYAERLLQTQTRQRDPGLVDGLINSGALQVLIRPSVDTPRKVKRLLNDYIVRYGLVSERQREWGSEESLTRDLPVLAKMTVLLSEFPEFAERLRDDLGLIDWINKIRQGHEEELEPYQREICREYYESDANGRLLTDKPKAPYRTLLEFLGLTWQYNVDPETIRRHLYLARDPEGAAVGDGFLRRLLSAAQSGQFSALEKLAAENANPETLLTFLAHRAKTARGIVRTNLALAILKLSNIVNVQSAGRGAILAAGELAARVNEFQRRDIRTELPPIQVLPYLRFMPSQACRDWVQLVDAWVKENLEQHGPLMFNKDALASVADLGSEVMEPLNETLWQWVQDESGQNHLASHLAALAEVPSFRSYLVTAIFPRFTEWLGTQTNEDDEEERQIAFSEGMEKVLKKWFQVFPTSELVAQNSGATWDIICRLLSPLPAIGRDWVLPLTYEVSEEIPSDWALSVTAAVVGCQEDSDWKTASGPVTQFVDHMLLRFGSTVGVGSSVMDKLLKGFKPSEFEPILDLVHRHWAAWSPEAKAIFHETVIKYVWHKNSGDFLKRVLGWIRHTSHDVSEPNRVFFYKQVGEVVSNHWADAGRMEMVNQALVDQRMWSVPEAAKENIYSILEAQAFVADREVNRTRPLLLLSKTIGELAPEKLPSFMERVYQSFLVGEPAGDRFAAACQVVIMHAPILRQPSSFITSLIDLLLGAVSDDARKEPASQALNAVIRVLPWSTLSSRKTQLERGLSASTAVDCSDTLATLSVLAEHETTLAFADVIVGAVSALKDDAKLSAIARWVSVHGAQVDAQNLAIRLLQGPDDQMFWKHLVQAGGVSMQSRLIQVISDLILANVVGLEVGLSALARIGTAVAERLSPQVMKLMVHCLTGSDETQGIALRYLSQVAPATVLTTGEKSRLRNLLIDCYEGTAAPENKVHAVEALAQLNLLTRSAIKAVQAALPVDEHSKRRIEELVE